MLLKIASAHSLLFAYADMLYGPIIGAFLLALVCVLKWSGLSLTTVRGLRLIIFGIVSTLVLVLGYQSYRCFSQIFLSDTLHGKSIDIRDEMWVVIRVIGVFTFLSGVACGLLLCRGFGEIETKEGTSSGVSSS